MRIPYLIACALSAVGCSGADSPGSELDSGTISPDSNQQPTACAYMRPQATGNEFMMAWSTSRGDSETFISVVGPEVNYEGRPAFAVEVDWSHQNPRTMYLSRELSCAEYVHFGREGDSWGLSIEGAPEEGRSFDIQTWTYTWSRHQELVLVPAGQFDDCYDLEMRQTDTGDLVSDSIYCLGVGSVSATSFYPTYTGQTVLSSYSW